MTLGEALAAGLAALGLDLDDAARGKLLAYLDLLEKWNRTHNLTSIRDRSRMLSHHVLDSLAVLSHLPSRPGVRLIDVGSGGGLPGIPLAIARPDWRVALLDSNRKKAAFLRQAASELRLANVDVVAMRAEEFVANAAFDVVIARALSELPRFVALARHLLAPGGQLVAMKAGYPQAEVAQLPRDVHLRAAPALQIPGVEGERHLLIMDAA
jgi:16S rRNA (guanine527-N7)-methyltransferase